MKKIKHKPDFEPFALVIETHEDKSDLLHLIQAVSTSAGIGSRAQLTAKRLLSLINDLRDE